MRRGLERRSILNLDGLDVHGGAAEFCFILFWYELVNSALFLLYYLPLRVIASALSAWVLFMYWGPGQLSSSTSSRDISNSICGDNPLRFLWARCYGNSFAGSKTLGKMPKGLKLVPDSK